MRNRVSQFSRLLVALAFFPALALAENCVTYTASSNGKSCPDPDPQAASTCAAQAYGAANGFAGCTATLTTGAYGAQETYRVDCTAHPNTSTITAALVTGACPVCPAAGQNVLYGLDAFDGSGSTTCHNGCEYTTPAPALQIHCSASSGACTNGTGVVQSQSTGFGCGSVNVNGASNPPTFDHTNPTPASCDPSGTVCAATSGGKNCGTFNGDEVCVGTVANGTCVGYASGGVACASSATPPVPNNGTPGTPANPALQVTANGQTVNYYNSTQVSASTTTVTTTNPVQALPTGTQGVGSSGSGGGSGSVSVTGTVAVAGNVGVNPSAANGDCGAGGVNCAGDSSVPTLPTQDTIATSTTNYVGALSSVPIVAAVSGISASVPTGTCPTGTFTVYGTSYTIDAQCTLWTSVAAVVQLVMLAVWALAGVRILMSA